MFIAVKEHGRGINNKQAYSYLKSNITINLIYFIVMWLDVL